MARDVDYTKWVNVWNKPAGKRPSETVGIKAVKIESTKILNNLPSSGRKEETTEVAG